jgi:flagellar hook-length control protein FliK
MSETVVLATGPEVQTITNLDPAERAGASESTATPFAAVFQGSLVAVARSLSEAARVGADEHSESVAMFAESGKMLPSEATAESSATIEDLIEDAEESTTASVVPPLTTPTPRVESAHRELVPQAQERGVLRIRVAAGQNETGEALTPEHMQSPSTLGQNDKPVGEAFAWSVRTLAGGDPQVPLPEARSQISPVTTSPGEEGRAQSLSQVASGASPTPDAEVVSKHTTFKLELPVGTKGWGDELTNRMLLLVNQRAQVAEVKLNPPHLGPMEIRVALDQDATNISFTVQGTGVREAVEATLPRLRELFNEAGVSLQDVNVAERHGGDGREGREHLPGETADASEREGVQEHSTGIAMKSAESPVSSRALLDAYV